MDTDQKIVALPFASCSTPKDKYDDIVTVLEEALERAKSGEFRAILVAYSRQDTRAGARYSGQYSELVYALTLAQHTLITEIASPV